MKKLLVIVSLCLIPVVFANQTPPGIHGNIQIHAAKTLYGIDANLDQLYGRANLMWAFEEDSTFSSLIQVRAYPSGFSYERLVGASYIAPNGAEGSSLDQKVPAIARRSPSNSDLPTIQIYQAWIAYKFPDFNLKLGRLITQNTKSLHFGNYLDCDPGGSFTFSREGIHNALEGYKVFGVTDTRAHIGVGDYMGNRGFLRVYETIRPSSAYSINLGYRINMFDLIHYYPHDSSVVMNHRLVLATDITPHKDLNMFLEAAWLYSEDSETDETISLIPVTLSINYTLPKALKSFLWKKMLIPDVLDAFKVECEYMYDRKASPGAYSNIDQDFMWNLYGEKTWFKRMLFQGGLFAAPTIKRAYNVGIGVRFTSKIN
ncbi:MAG: hypothetical protein HQK83_17835 [Fibrobacteria bacterium]|nr:hypothetical protein [Fibrobacteria bacterium]